MKTPASLQLFVKVGCMLYLQQLADQVQAVLFQTRRKGSEGFAVVHAGGVRPATSKGA